MLTFYESDYVHTESTRSEWKLKILRQILVTGLNGGKKQHIVFLCLCNLNFSFEYLLFGEVENTMHNSHLKNEVTHVIVHIRNLLNNKVTEKSYIWRAMLLFFYTADNLFYLWKPKSMSNCLWSDVGSFGVKGLKTQNSGNKSKIDNMMLSKIDLAHSHETRKYIKWFLEDQAFSPWFSSSTVHHCLEGVSQPRNGK
jgi:hypothetical protein